MQDAAKKNRQSTNPHPPHPHFHESTADVLAELEHLKGHMELVRDLISKGEEPADALMEIASAQEDLRLIGKTILKDHMKHCIADAVQNGDMDAINNLGKALTQFVR